QRFAIFATGRRTEAEVGGVFICQEVVSEFVRKVETTTAGAGRSVDQSDAHIIDADVAAVYDARTEVQRERKESNALYRDLQISKRAFAASQERPRLRRTSLCFLESRDTRRQSDRLDRERIDFSQQFDVSGRSLEFVFQPLHVSIRRQALPVARDDRRGLGEEPLDRTAEHLS